MTRRSAAVRTCWLLFSLGVLGATAAAARIEPAGLDVADPARSALAKGNYPWYDAANDRVKPVNLSPSRGESWLRAMGERLDRGFRAVGDFLARIARALHLGELSRFGRLLPAVLIGAGVILLVVLIRVLWHSRGRPSGEGVASVRSLGGAGRIAMLPGAMAGAGVADPWAEAVECRRRGDLSGAIIHLFAYQLLELDRLGLIRLTPGRTGRNYVRGLDDERLRGPLSATLELFELAYYGHKQLPVSSFESAWAGAESFRAHLASIGNRTS